MIRRELIFQYHVEPSQIVFDEDIQRDIYREYVSARDIRNKSVLIVIPDITLSDLWKNMLRIWKSGFLNLSIIFNGWTKLETGAE